MELIIDRVGGGGGGRTMWSLDKVRSFHFPSAIDSDSIRRAVDLSKFFPLCSSLCCYEFFMQRKILEICLKAMH